MSWLERFGIKKKEGLSEKDRSMMEVQNPEAKLWEQEKSRGLYSFPLPEIEDSVNIGQEIADRDPKESVVEQIGPYIVSRSPETHTKAQIEALDFLVPYETPVLAADSGRIISGETILNNSEWESKHKSNEEDANYMNYITIEHADGERTQYCHLAKDCLPPELAEKLKVGEEIFVEKGQQIAITGKTGYMDRDHLHFIVYRFEEFEIIGGKKVENPEGYKSLVPRFEELEAKNKE